jgi:hypothetical protein
MKPLDNSQDTLRPLLKSICPLNSVLNERTQVRGVTRRYLTDRPTLPGAVRIGFFIAGGRTMEP